MKLSFDVIKKISVLVLFIASLASNASIDSFNLIDEKANKKWQFLTELQEDSNWIENQVEMDLHGSVFQKGWTNPRVERSIVPDKNEGLLVIDSVTIGSSLLTQAATLSTNLLLSMYLPYVQGGPIKEKRFTNIRRASTYQEALEKEHFELKTIPLNHSDFKYMEDGEMFTTNSTSGFLTRYSIMMLDLLELAVPGLIDFGPKAKIHVKKSIKITIIKEDDDTAIVSLENTNEKGYGVGTGLGIFLEEMLNLPVSIGVNSPSGYSPLVFNFKKDKKKLSHIFYKINLASDDGENAYKKFLDGDFTPLQDLSKVKDSAVSISIKKQGIIRTVEKSFGLNLILWKSGVRNIKVNGTFKTQLSNGTKYNYKELEITRVRDRAGFSGKEKEMLTFSAIVPLNKNDIGFVVDTNYYYRDTKTKGKELIKISKKLDLLGIPSGIPIKFNKKKKYGETQLQINIRFSSNSIKTILNTDNETLWEALATSVGFANPYVWLTKDSRDLYKACNEVTKDLNKAQKIFLLFSQMKKEISAEKKAKALINFLKDRNYGPLLHKTMINIVGLGEIMGQGHIAGI